MCQQHRDLETGRRRTFPRPRWLRPHRPGHEQEFDLQSPREVPLPPFGGIRWFYGLRPFKAEAMEDGEQTQGELFYPRLRHLQAGVLGQKVRRDR